MNKEQFKIKLKKLKLTQKRFAEEVEYSYSAIKGWKTCPKWVDVILEHKEMIHTLQNLKSIGTTIEELKDLTKKYKI